MSISNSIIPIKPYHVHYKRLYSILNSMKNRCYNQNHKSYHRYGGRGITICDEWNNNIGKFIEWAINNGYNSNLTIDRLNNDKGYSPDNCKWSTRIEQQHNRGMYPHNKSGVSGVYYDKAKSKYVAVIWSNSIRISLGAFININDAINARKNAEIKYWGIGGD